MLVSIIYVHIHVSKDAFYFQAENVMATDRGVVPHITLIDLGSSRFTPIGGEVMMDLPAGSIDFVGMWITRDDIAVLICYLL